MEIRKSSRWRFSDNPQAGLEQHPPPRNVAEQDYDAPSTPTERRLAAAWATVLGIPADQIGRNDNFFDRGGSSLLAVKLAVALDRAVSLKELTRHPILADMASLIDGKSERRDGLSQCSPEPGPCGKQS